MANSFKYWDDCVDPRDMEAMWMDPEVFKEWTDVGETKGNKVHLSRDPDGQPYLTQIEMKAVAQIVVNRHLRLQLDTDMICALAEIESDRQLLVERYNKKIKESTVGIMQVLQTTAEMLFRDVGYRSYQIEGNPDLLYRPFVNIYYGAAYLKYLYGYDGKERDEEFIVRAFRGGPKKAAHKSTSEYFQRYLSVKQSLPSRKLLESRIPGNNLSVPDVGPVPKAGETWTYWDSRASAEDMEEMWRHPAVLKEWTKSGERRGRDENIQDVDETFSKHSSKSI
ncbi:hypothetical protein QJS10_CPB22g00295 [Acorus calamus]|uniref:Transglycosylase SLT domain-containing protein n=1 Tax=Acorus calamus TaxID=4465 RepID=A0AAV9BZU8_ACOCL|nr:hypothetical protein QJS10_CPB22g00295 [Acorus calamus]